MREAPDQLLVVQGGPGTGKTAIGLHRGSWILYNASGRIGSSDLLVIGPSQTFIRYINKVLPGLGDRDVRQLAVGALGPEVRLGALEEEATIRLKGEARMRELIDRALQDRISQPSGDVTFTVGDRPRLVDNASVAGALPALRQLSYAEGRSRLRELVRQRTGLGPTEGGDALDNALDQIWPQLTPQSFLRDLLGSEGRLISAAGDELSAADVRRLYRRRAERLADEVWSPSDVPLLDYAEYRISGQVPGRYAHIIIDEAQDLSPMQLDSIARRSTTGAYTVIGDLAQSTGPWARDSWEDVMVALSSGLAPKVVELEIGYRVPKEIFDLASGLLPYAAPAVQPPRAVRTGDVEPYFHAVDEPDRAGAVVQAAREHAGHGFSVGIICPPALHDDVTSALEAAAMNWTDAGVSGEIGATITLLTPEAAKGLEFDAAVVVEPTEIAGEANRDLRLLYVALTRATRRLSVVHAGPRLPVLIDHGGDGLLHVASMPTAAPSAVPEHPAISGAGSVSRLASAIAADLAAQVRSAVTPDLWREVLVKMSEDLGIPNGGADASGTGEAP